MSGPPRLVADASCALGESPVWDERREQLYWVDIEGRRVWRHTPADGTTAVRTLTTTTGAIALREDGGLVAAVRDGFAELDFDEGRLRPIASVEPDDPRMRMNDAKCDARGRFWAGAMHEQRVPGRGALYRLDPDGTLARALAGLTVPNGLDWSLDDRTMYVVDTFAHRVYAYDFDAAAGALGDRRTFVAIPAAQGLIDGLVVDAADHVWIALCYGAAVRRYSADGALVEERDVPVTMPTSCAFGGARLTDLFVTSARTSLSAWELASQPHAGGVFACEVDAPGRATNRFAG